MSVEEKSPLEEFVNLYVKIKDDFGRLPEILTKLSNFSDDIVRENRELKDKLKDVDGKFQTLQKEYESKDSKISDVEKEAAIYKKKLEKVEEQMSGLRDMYEDMAQERSKDMEIQDLLAIYTVLFEKVFAADPHTKILLLLQGIDKEIWTRDELVKTTGFTPAAILKALHDLRNNGIVDLDEAALEVKLAVTE
ncbi:MAG: hypothetical protein KGD64_06210 [Candidatus Heimdallarchaeota archaeon]|nr:hypothetical protein [Candidatus Heimdallarchaeota archaeon]